jgi:hypothetical protein
MSAKTILLACLLASLTLLTGCDEQPRFDSGGGDGDSDSDSDSDGDSDSDSDSDSDTDQPQTHVVALQNGTNGYQGCVDVAVPVPEGSGWDEITPEDEMMWVYHYTWTGG